MEEDDDGEANEEEEEEDENQKKAFDEDELIESFSQSVSVQNSPFKQS